MVKTFATYELEQLTQANGVADLSHELIHDMADVFEVQLSDRPTASELDALVDNVGTSTVLEDNIAVVQKRLGADANGLAIAAEWVNRSAVQDSLNRSLWTCEKNADRVHNMVAMGGAANWQDRVANMLSDATVIGGNPRRVYMLTGNRPMIAKTEEDHKLVKNANIVLGRPPTEFEYARRFIVPILKDAGHTVVLNSYDTSSGDEIAKDFFEANGELLGSSITFARTANAGINMAIQFRNAARAIDSDFDNGEGSMPYQAFIRTDQFPVASTELQNNEPGSYQRPYTVLKQIALTAKLLQETADELRTA